MFFLSHVLSPTGAESLQMYLSGACLPQTSSVTQKKLIAHVFCCSENRISPAYWQLHDRYNWWCMFIGRNEAGDITADKYSTRHCNGHPLIHEKPRL